MGRMAILLGVALVALVIFLSSVFIVDEREKALVLQFGQIKAVKEEPGLAVKIPFLQEVVRYDGRIQSLETESLEVTPADNVRLVVDAFARWRISDVEQFRRAAGGGGITTAEQRLENILNAELRAVLGSVTSSSVLSADRVGLMNQIRDAAIVQARALGVEVIDVRIKRADLPDQNLAATFARMQAEREREAADERARGQETAQRIRAQADRSALEIVSEARRDSDIVRGEADAERNRIFAEAFGKDEEFFAFYRSLSAYEEALKGENSQLVISPDSDFFNYLNSVDGAASQSSGAAATAN
ncbi:protease modulator HflC [Oceanomicrobium pacificus]|uniref:Protein HflC n=1 Tax=Oceanomicrobium pacificus TaxID=2692916 RepID=A0A6B0TNU1_9RHOB|nr:protease modulator HflC [Oceanomicrobium pacificus]MXU65536.1 protease modulator HflC [Oceanomicrobium pacificus]